MIGTAEPAAAMDTAVNLIGEYNIAGEIWDIEKLLNQAGIRIHAKITGDGRYKEIAGAHRGQSQYDRVQPGAVGPRGQDGAKIRDSLF
ncbi:hypothetical protein HMSSN036_70730 [Paenibacillus macerans]|nr:hypothetical protein HMSSN036_70730 [Paenibacillus macerans]